MIKKIIPIIILILLLTGCNCNQNENEISYKIAKESCEANGGNVEITYCHGSSRICELRCK